MWVTLVMATYPLGKGIGGKMLEAFKSGVKNFGAKVLLLEPIHIDLTRLDFIQNMGVVIAGRLEYYFRILLLL